MFSGYFALDRMLVLVALIKISTPSGICKKGKFSGSKGFIFSFNNV